MREQLAAASWERVRRDVEPLLEPSVDPALVDRELVLRLVDQ
jgi:hypothetical protein